MDDFHSLLSTIERTLCIKCSNYKEDYIRRRLFSRMNATQISDYLEYQKFLLSSPEERDKLKNALTINVTKFFRDPEVFDILKKEILPEILKRNTRIRIWSAGCSSGEEPYSYAILLSEIGLLRKDIDGLIYASDIDMEILKKAREGVYERASLDNLSESQKKRHFTLRKDGKYEVKPQIKEKVRFQYHDLMSGTPLLRNFDLISCRNVTIYFTEKQKDDLARVFHQGLVPGGFYIMGMSEFMSKEISRIFKPYKPLLKIFTKNGT